MTAVTKNKQLPLQTDHKTIRDVMAGGLDAYHNVFAARAAIAHAEDPGDIMPFDVSSAAKRKGLAQGYFFETPQTDEPRNPYATYAEKQKLTGDDVKTTLVNTFGEFGRRLEFPVTGASSAAVATLQPVFMIDNYTLSLTPATSCRNKPAGYVEKWLTGTTCLVFLYSAHAQRLMDFAGGGRRKTIFLGHFDADSIADGDLRTDMTDLINDHCKIVKLFAVIDKALTTTGDSTVLHLEIGSVALTGGLLTLTGEAGSIKGLQVNATAITAANEFHEGDTLSVVAASTADLTGGTFDLFCVIELEAGH